MAVWAKGGQFSPMTALTAPFRDPRRALLIGTVGIAAAASWRSPGRRWSRRSTGDRGIAAVASSGDIQIGGIEVDVTGKTARKRARRAGARRSGWRGKRLGGPAMPDGQLYSHRLGGGDRERAARRQPLCRPARHCVRPRAGGRVARQGRSGGRTRPRCCWSRLPSPAGAQTVFEVRNPWQRAWAEYQPGASTIDYVRPSGAGGDSLLLTCGPARAPQPHVVAQRARPVRRERRARADRPPRTPIARRAGEGHLHRALRARQPAARQVHDDRAERGRTARDARPGGAAGSTRSSSRLLPKASLSPIPTLNLGAPQIDPAIQRLIDMGRAAEADEAAAARAAAASRCVGERRLHARTRGRRHARPGGDGQLHRPVRHARCGRGRRIARRGARRRPGVRGAAATSTAIGGTSVMRVSYGGDRERSRRGVARARLDRAPVGQRALDQPVRAGT